MVVAILGTTISPYLFFWQAEEEVEEVKERDDAKPLERAPEQARAEFHRIRWDTYIGMGFSNLVALFIMSTTAATLQRPRRHQHPDLVAGRRGAGAHRRALRLRWCSPWASSARACWPCRSWPARPPIAMGEAFGWHVGLARKLRPGQGLLRRDRRRHA